MSVGPHHEPGDLLAGGEPALCEGSRLALSHVMENLCTGTMWWVGR